MWESHGHDPSALSLNYDFLQEQNEKNIKELQRLRELLTENNISWEKDTQPNSGIVGKIEHARCPRSPPKPAPELPREIHFQIMGYCLKSSKPIIDPFFALRKDNLTAEEQEHSGREDITIGLLGVCKAFNAEGTRLLVENNDFIFTQVTAVENFARIPEHSRARINHVIIRVVGRYYDRKGGEKDIGRPGSTSPQYTEVSQFPFLPN